MAEFRGIFSLISCLFLAFLSATFASQFRYEKFCTNNSLVDTRTKPEGNIVFPLTTSNYTGEICHVEIRSPLDGKTELTLMNLRRKTHNKACLDSIEIHNEVQYNATRYCKSVGNMEKLVLRSTILMRYKTSFRNEIGETGAETVISVHFKRLNIDNSTKLCRHVLTAEHDTFKTAGYPEYPLHGECEWVINTERRGGVSIEFQIQNSRNLNSYNNYIEVRQGESSSAPLLAGIYDRFHSTIVKSASNKVWIRVKSSGTQGIGFQATYRSNILCEVIKAKKQLNFESSETSSCKTWNLTAPPGHIAALSFSAVYLESTDPVSCMGNVLEVWDGKTNKKYCNIKSPPPIIVSKGQKLVVTYRSTYSAEHVDSSASFKASFTSIFQSNYKSNCFVEDEELKFRCTTQQVIPCEWQCDGAMQCSDNSDESTCSDVQARWHKLQVFVIVMGSICASTVIFCVGLVCFRKCIINDRSLSPRRSHHLSLNDQSPLTPNADLPSPPPCYFTDQDEEAPASVIRGTFFFGDEFSQSTIHSASLFGIPPPRYRSTESLHQSTAETRSIWQRSISSIPLVATDTSRNTVVIPVPEEDPPDYESLTTDKDEQILTTARNNESTLQPATRVSENLRSSSCECIENDNNFETVVAIELLPATASLANEVIPDDEVVGIDLGKTNPVATLTV